jgi:hypothetical protein
MAKMLNKNGELLRIDPKDSKKIEYSTNSGNNWYNRYSGSSSTGAFEDLTDNGNEILGSTSEGLFYSTNKGSNWYKRN